MLYLRTYLMGILIMKHKSVLLNESIDNLDIKADGVYVDATLGCKLDVPTIHGDVTVEVPAGIQNAQQLRIKGKGIKDLRSNVLGDEYIILDIKVPTKLTKDEKDLYNKLKNIQEKQGDSIFAKFKKAFKLK